MIYIRIIKFNQELKNLLYEKNIDMDIYVNDTLAKTVDLYTYLV